MDEVKLFVTPRKEVVDLVKKVLADAGSAVKKDLNSIESDKLDYLTARKVEDFMVKVENTINQITREYSEADMDEVQKEHALNFRSWVSEIYESVSGDKLVLLNDILRR
jgi:hypothetical protein